MACVSKTLSGIAQDCNTNQGGIITAWVAVENPKVVVEAGKVTAFGASVAWYKYNFKRNTGNLTSTLNVDQTTGTNYVTNELVLQFSRMETAKRVEMSALSVNEMFVIVKDANKKYWLLGSEDDPVMASAGSGQTGTAKTDGNFYTITLSCDSDSFPLEVAESIIPE